MSQSQKKPGRPTKYRPEYCDMLIDHMATGKSFESFGGLKNIRAGRNTLYEWLKNHPDFQDAKEKGWTACLLHWEDTAAATILDKDTNAVALQINMRNRFGWNDRKNYTDSKGLAETMVFELAG